MSALGVAAPNYDYEANFELTVFFELFVRSFLALLLSPRFLLLLLPAGDTIPIVVGFGFVPNFRSEPSPLLLASAKDGKGSTSSRSG